MKTSAFPAAGGERLLHRWGGWLVPLCPQKVALSTKMEAPAAGLAADAA